MRYLRLVRRVHRLIGHRNLRHRQWWQPVRRSLLDRRLWQPFRDSVASAISIGAFFAMMPMPGQTLAAAVVAVRQRANIPFAIASCFISNPLTEVPIRLYQLKFGHWLNDGIGIPMPRFGAVDVTVGGKLVHLDVSEFILGFLCMGLLLALVAYPIVHLFSALLPEHLPIKPPRLTRRRESPENSSS